ncbi:hypothetical protein AGABI1DRAFT_122398 [Agaricus bisporus var. burnettii JB137-S8]|uniref:ER-bound oxygenase mpaB/mpaB'/Rubber oxygenase catalytic domain-containing protein n=1 Tax=Agaricus bisporus var. burnettii (strain JB137-S8 / ATCC MYA-4627 / FGSC 10392) TaxID=597362 RepID=K5X1A2_AGABU|nr:uncharacterized protein AGABI1DRAFT_122398 [Agaricus bisporus var. burnettii JB137-S8]EKM76918.1 hypothetical protein AGABI1DRAFT_122398 [Agaricus bisporus var. burnettii JB137-S8]
MISFSQVLDATVPHVSNLLRFKRYREVHKKYQHKYEAGKLTPEDAQKIMRVSAMYDMPRLLGYSLAFALFKTYGIPSISKLLAATKQLKGSETISRRYADTEILISTWVGCPISGYATEDRTGEIDPRAMIALARVNYLHSRYNIAWARKYGWRALSPLEEHAYYIFWVEIGKRMGIRDIPESLESMKLWSRAYEKQYMVANPINSAVAGYTMGELLYSVPNAFGLRRWVENLSTCLLDEPVRIAMMKPAQPWYNHLFLRSVLYSISFVQRWLMLPRSDSNHRHPVLLDFLKNPDGTINPRMHPTKYTVLPWYKPEPSTILGRTWDRLLVLMKIHSHVPSKSLRSEGYRLEEVGPIKLETVAREEVLKAAAVLQGCPITGAFTQ